MTRQMAIGLIVIVMVVSIMMAGCASTVDNISSPSPSATNTSVQTTTTPTSTQTAVMTVTVTATPLPTPTSSSRIETAIVGDKWTSIAQDSGIVQGVAYGFGVDVLTVPSYKKLCGQEVNFSLDGQPAGGTRTVDPSPECWRSAQLSLSANDTAQLSLGMHTLTVDYLGDNTYAPSHWEGTFKVKETVWG